MLLFIYGPKKQSEQVENGLTPHSVALVFAGDTTQDSAEDISLKIINYDKNKSNRAINFAKSERAIDFIFEGNISFPSTEELKMFLVEFLQDQGLETANLLSVHQFNQLIMQNNNIQGLHESLKTYQTEEGLICNPTFLEKRGFLNRLLGN